MTQVQEDTKYIKEKFTQECLSLKAFLDTHKLLLFFLTPKMGGKSTYIGFLKELFPNKFTVISAGNLVREIQTMTDSDAVAKLTPIFKEQTDSVLNDIKTANVKKLVSDQVLYSLLLSSLSNPPRPELVEGSPRPEGGRPLGDAPSVILDGFPRTLEQLAMSWDLANQLKKQSFTPFVLNITVSDAVLDKRMISRRVCSKCGLVSNTESLQNVTLDDIKYDKDEKSFFLTCPNCQIPLVKKSTDTELSEMLERRKAEKQVYATMVKQAQEKGIKYASLRTDTPADKFSGNDKQLNLSNSYQFRPEDDPPLAEDKLGQISSKTVRFVAKGETGEVYAYHPRQVVGLITKVLAKQFFPTHSCTAPLPKPKDNFGSH